MQQSDERLAAALDDLADTAEAAGRDQHQAAALARTVARQQRRGHGEEPHVRAALELVTTSARRVASSAAELRRIWATHLAGRGLSVRQIGDRLGISHQRVSTLLADRRGKLADSGQQ